MRPTLVIRWVCKHGHQHQNKKTARECDNRVPKPKALPQ